MRRFLHWMFRIDPRGNNLTKKNHVNEYSNEELIEFLEISEQLTALELGMLCAEILKRMNIETKDLKS